jgi:hypothetical protein
MQDAAAQQDLIGCRLAGIGRAIGKHHHRLPPAGDALSVEIEEDRCQPSGIELRVAEKLGLGEDHRQVRAPGFGKEHGVKPKGGLLDLFGVQTVRRVRRNREARKLEHGRWQFLK